MLSQHADSRAPSPALTRPRAETFERLEAQITELWGHLNAATYRFLALVAEFDRHEGYARHVLPSTAHWLNWQCGIGMIAAREKVRVARALESLPEIRAGFASGEFSYSKVRAMTRVATPANEAVLASIVAPWHGLARREARAQVSLDAASRRGEDSSGPTPQPFGELVLRRERDVRVQRAAAARDRRARRASAPSGGGCAARAQGLRDERDELRPHVDVNQFGWSSAQHNPHGEPGRRAASRGGSLSRNALRRDRSDVERGPLSVRRARGSGRADAEHRGSGERTAPRRARPRAPLSRSRRSAAWAATAPSSASLRVATASR